MSISAIDSVNVSVRAALKVLAFVVSLFIAIFSASVGYGLLKMLLQDSGTNVGMAELATHGGSTVLFFVLAGLGAYAAKKCYW